MIDNPPILILGLAALIGVVHLLWASIAAQPQRGLKWNVGPRDEPRVLTGMAGRLERAFANYRETFPLFAAALLGCYLGGQMDDLVVTAGWIYVIARALYLPLYAFGVTYVRSLVWGAAFAAIVAILISLLLP